MIKIERKNKLDAERKKQIVEAYLKNLDRKEKNFVLKIKPLFEAQKEEVLHKIGLINAPKQLMKLYLQKKIDDVLFDKKEAVQAFIKFEKPLLTDTLMDGAAESLELVGVPFSAFDLQVVTITNYLRKQSSKFALKVNDATIRQLRRELKTGLLEGESIADLKTRVENVYDMATGYRAERMARTEMGSALNYGSWEGMTQSKVVDEKEWISVIDDRTRGAGYGDDYDHISADGQIVPVNNRFEISGESLQYPRDPVGSAGNIINCRCKVIAVIK